MAFDIQVSISGRFCPVRSLLPMEFVPLRPRHLFRVVPCDKTSVSLWLYMCVRILVQHQEASSVDEVDSQLALTQQLLDKVQTLATERNELLGEQTRLMAMVDNQEFELKWADEIIHFVAGLDSALRHVDALNAQSHVAMNGSPLMVRQRSHRSTHATDIDVADDSTLGSFEPATHVHARTAGRGRRNDDQHSQRSVGAHLLELAQEARKCLPYLFTVAAETASIAANGERATLYVVKHGSADATEVQDKYLLWSVDAAGHVHHAPLHGPGSGIYSQTLTLSEPVMCFAQDDVAMTSYAQSRGTNTARGAVGAVDSLLAYRVSDEDGGMVEGLLEVVNSLNNDVDKTFAQSQVDQLMEVTKQVRVVIRIVSLIDKLSTQLTDTANVIQIAKYTSPVNLLGLGAPAATHTEHSLDTTHARVYDLVRHACKVSGALSCVLVVNDAFVAEGEEGELSHAPNTSQQSTATARRNGARSDGAEAWRVHQVYPLDGIPGHVYTCKPAVKDRGITHECVHSRDVVWVDSIDESKQVCAQGDKHLKLHARSMRELAEAETLRGSTAGSAAVMSVPLLCRPSHALHHTYEHDATHARVVGALQFVGKAQRNGNEAVFTEHDCHAVRAVAEALRCILEAQLTAPREQHASQCAVLTLTAPDSIEYEEGMHVAGEEYSDTAVEGEDPKAVCVDTRLVRTFDTSLSLTPPGTLGGWASLGMLCDHLVRVFNASDVRMYVASPLESGGVADESLNEEAGFSVLIGDSQPLMLHEGDGSAPEDRGVVARKLRKGVGLCGTCFRDGAAVCVRNALDDGRYDGDVDGHLTDSARAHTHTHQEDLAIMCVPIRLRTAPPATTMLQGDDAVQVGSGGVCGVVRFTRHVQRTNHASKHRARAPHSEVSQEWTQDEEHMAVCVCADVVSPSIARHLYERTAVVKHAEHMQHVEHSHERMHDYICQLEALHARGNAPLDWGIGDGGIEDVWMHALAECLSECFRSGSSACDVAVTSLSGESFRRRVACAVSGIDGEEQPLFTQDNCAHLCIADGITGDVASLGHTLYVGAVESDPRYHTSVDGTPAPHTHTMVSVPVKLRPVWCENTHVPSPSGVFVCVNVRFVDGEARESDSQVVQHVVDHCVALTDNRVRTQVFESQRQSLERTQRAVDALGVLSSVTFQSLAQEGDAEGMANTLCRTLHACATSVFECDEVFIHLCHPASHDKEITTRTLVLSDDTVASEVLHVEPGSVLAQCIHTNKIMRCDPRYSVAQHPRSRTCVDTEMAESDRATGTKLLGMSAHGHHECSAACYLPLATSSASTAATRPTEPGGEVIAVLQLVRLDPSTTSARAQRKENIAGALLHWIDDDTAQHTHSHVQATQSVIKCMGSLVERHAQTMHTAHKLAQNMLMQREVRRLEAREAWHVAYTHVVDVLRGCESVESVLKCVCSGTSDTHSEFGRLRDLLGGWAQLCVWVHSHTHHRAATKDVEHAWSVTANGGRLECPVTGLLADCAARVRALCSRNVEPDDECVCESNDFMSDNLFDPICDLAGYTRADSAQQDEPTTHASPPHDQGIDAILYVPIVCNNQHIATLRCIGTKTTLENLDWVTRSDQFRVGVAVGDALLRCIHAEKDKEHVRQLDTLLQEAAEHHPAPHNHPEVDRRANSVQRAEPTAATLAHLTEAPGRWSSGSEPESPPSTPTQHPPTHSHAHVQTPSQQRREHMVRVFVRHNALSRMFAHLHTFANALTSIAPKDHTQTDAAMEQLHSCVGSVLPPLLSAASAALFVPYATASDKDTVARGPHNTDPRDGAQDDIPFLSCRGAGGHLEILKPRERGKGGLVETAWRSKARASMCVKDVHDADKCDLVVRDFVRVVEFPTTITCVPLLNPGQAPGGVSTVVGVLLVVRHGDDAQRDASGHEKKKDASRSRDRRIQEPTLQRNLSDLSYSNASTTRDDNAPSGPGHALSDSEALENVVACNLSACVQSVRALAKASVLRQGVIDGVMNLCQLASFPVFDSGDKCAEELLRAACEIGYAQSAVVFTVEEKTQRVGNGTSPEFSRERFASFLKHSTNSHMLASSDKEADTAAVRQMMGLKDLSEEDGVIGRAMRTGSVHFCTRVDELYKETATPDHQVPGASSTVMCIPLHCAKRRANSLPTPDAGEGSGTYSYTAHGTKNVDTLVVLFKANPRSYTPILRTASPTRGPSSPRKASVSSPFVFNKYDICRVMVLCGQGSTSMRACGMLMEEKRRHHRAMKDVEDEWANRLKDAKDAMEERTMYSQQLVQAMVNLTWKVHHSANAKGKALSAAPQGTKHRGGGGGHSTRPSSPGGFSEGDIEFDAFSYSTRPARSGESVGTGHTAHTAQAGWHRDREPPRQQDVAFQGLKLLVEGQIRGVAMVMLHCTVCEMVWFDKSQSRHLVPDIPGLDDLVAHVKHTKQPFILSHVLSHSHAHATIIPTHAHPHHDGLASIGGSTAAHLAQSQTAEAEHAHGDHGHHDREEELVEIVYDCGLADIIVLPVIVQRGDGFRIPLRHKEVQQHEQGETQEVVGVFIVAKEGGGGPDGGSPGAHAHGNSRAVGLDTDSVLSAQQRIAMHTFKRNDIRTAESIVSFLGACATLSDAQHTQVKTIDSLSSALTQETQSAESNATYTGGHVAVSDAVSQAMSSGALRAILCDLSGGLLPQRTFAVIAADQGTGKLRSYGSSQAREFSMAEGICGLVARSGVCEYVSDATKHHAYSPRVDAAHVHIQDSGLSAGQTDPDIKRPPAGGVAALPIVSQVHDPSTTKAPQVRGVLLVNAVPARDASKEGSNAVIFSEDERALWSNVCVHIARALERIGAVESLRSSHAHSLALVNERLAVSEVAANVHTQAVSWCHRAMRCAVESADEARSGEVFAQAHMCNGVMQCMQMCEYDLREAIGAHSVCLYRFGDDQDVVETLHFYDGATGHAAPPQQHTQRRGTCLWSYDDHMDSVRRISFPRMPAESYSHTLKHARGGGIGRGGAAAETVMGPVAQCAASRKVVRIPARSRAAAPASSTVHGFRSTQAQHQHQQPGGGEDEEEVTKAHVARHLRFAKATHVEGPVHSHLQTADRLGDSSAQAASRGEPRLGGYVVVCLPVPRTGESDLCDVLKITVACSHDGRIGVTPKHEAEGTAVHSKSGDPGWALSVLSEDDPVWGVLADMVAMLQDHAQCVWSQAFCTVTMRDNQNLIHDMERDAQVRRRLTQLLSEGLVGCDGSSDDTANSHVHSHNGLVAFLASGLEDILGENQSAVHVFSVQPNPHFVTAMAQPNAPDGRGGSDVAESRRPGSGKTGTVSPLATAHTKSEWLLSTPPRGAGTRSVLPRTVAFDTPTQGSTLTAEQGRQDRTVVNATRVASPPPMESRHTNEQGSWRIITIQAPPGTNTVTYSPGQVLAEVRLSPTVGDGVATEVAAVARALVLAHHAHKQAQWHAQRAEEALRLMDHERSKVQSLESAVHAATAAANGVDGDSQPRVPNAVMESEYVRDVFHGLCFAIMSSVAPLPSAPSLPHTTSEAHTNTLERLCLVVATQLPSLIKAERAVLYLVDDSNDPMSSAPLGNVDTVNGMVGGGGGAIGAGTVVWSVLPTQAAFPHAQQVYGTSGSYASQPHAPARSRKVRHAAPRLVHECMQYGKPVRERVVVHRNGEDAYEAFDDEFVFQSTERAHRNAHTRMEACLSVLPIFHSTQSHTPIAVLQVLSRAEDGAGEGDAAASSSTQRVAGLRVLHGVSECVLECVCDVISIAVGYSQHHKTLVDTHVQSTVDDRLVYTRKRLAHMHTLVRALNLVTTHTNAHERAHEHTVEAFQDGLHAYFGTVCYYAPRLASADAATLYLRVCDGDCDMCGGRGCVWTLPNMQLPASQHNAATATLHTARRHHAKAQEAQNPPLTSNLATRMVRCDVASTLVHECIASRKTVHARTHHSRIVAHNHLVLSPGNVHMHQTPGPHGSEADDTHVLVTPVLSPFSSEVIGAVQLVKYARDGSLNQSGFGDLGLYDDEDTHGVDEALFARTSRAWRGLSSPTSAAPPSPALRGDTRDGSDFDDTGGLSAIAHLCTALGSAVEHHRASHMQKTHVASLRGDVKRMQEAKEAHRSVSEALDKTKSDLRQTRGRFETLRSKYGELEAQVVEQEEALERSRAEASALRTSIDAKVKLVASSDGERKALAKERDDAIMKLVQYRKHVKQARGSMQETLTKEEERARAQKEANAALQRKLDEAQKQVESLRSSYERAREVSSSSEMGKIASLTGEMEALAKENESLRSQQRILNARLRGLVSLEHQQSGELFASPSAAASRLSSPQHGLGVGVGVGPGVSWASGADGGSPASTLHHRSFHE